MELAQSGYIFFGKYPDPVTLAYLATRGVQLIVNLTSSVYTCNIKIINYPIKDGGIPDNLMTFSALIAQLKAAIEQSTFIFIHCDHGRGRTGLTVASLIGKYKNYKYRAAITELNKQYHKGYGKGRREDIPSHREQKHFVRKFLK